MIVELNGTSLRTARQCAHRMLERTNPVKSNDAPAPRAYKISAVAERLERQRMRAKVAGTRKLRLQLLSILHAWRSSVVAAVRRSNKREADVGQLDNELGAAVDAGILTDDQRHAIIAAVTEALASMDPKAIATAIAAAQQELFNAGLDSGKAEVGITWDMPPTLALDQLNAATIPFSQEIVDREVAAIKQALQDGIAAGDGIPAMAQRIQDTFDDGMHILAQGPPGRDGERPVVRVIPSDSWAEMVARTETSRAMNAGIMQTYRSAGVARVMWISAEDERQCAACEAADGDIVLLGQVFADVGATEPPAHPSCCPEGTLILTERGEVPIETVGVGDLVWTHLGRWRPVVGLMQREVSEHLWTVRAGHRILRITGNHPVYTPNGWTRAASLKVTDEVYCVNSEAVLSATSQPNNAPAVRSQVGILHRICGALFGNRVPTPTIDLYGKEAIGDSNVDHVFSHGVVKDRANASSSECVVDDGFIDGYGATLAASGFTGESVLAHLASTHGIVSGLRERSALGSARAAHPEVHSTASVALLEPDACKTADDCGPCDSVALRQGFNRSTGDVLPVDFPTLVVSKRPLHTAVVPIASFECLNFEGIVYNFEVAEDESYVAEGIVVHNCRCTVVSAGTAEASDDEAA